jgi:hypothetical protein
MPPLFACQPPGFRRRPRKRSRESRAGSPRRARSGSIATDPPTLAPRRPLPRSDAPVRRRKRDQTPSTLLPAGPDGKLGESPLRPQSSLKNLCRQSLRRRNRLSPAKNMRPAKSRAGGSDRSEPGAAGRIGPRSRTSRSSRPFESPDRLAPARVDSAAPLDKARSGAARQCGNDGVPEPPGRA